jgi:hypothetical protein
MPNSEEPIFATISSRRPNLVHRFGKMAQKRSDLDERNGRAEN